MPLRHNWKGYLKLSLVSVPVKSYSAVSADEGEIHFHQLHESCHSRVKYVKTCPIHGPLRPDEIVSGFEYSKGQFVVLEEGELERLRSEEDKMVNIDTIVPAKALDPIYLTERSSYLVPDGPVGNKPYALMEHCLNVRDSIAIARWIKNGKDQTVAIRPIEGLLVMTVLSSAIQIKRPEASPTRLPRHQSHLLN
nr:non-homologous end joining protein Ku [uncultured bacterium]